MLGLKRTDVVLWLAWVAAGTLGAMLTIVADLRLLGIPFGYQPGSLGYEVSSVLVGSVALAILQYVVLRAAAGIAALPATAWAAITVVVGIGSYAATAVWVSSPVLSGLVTPNVIELAMPFAFALIAALFLGMVLRKELHLQSALFVWPAAYVAAYAVDYAAIVWSPFLKLMDGLPLLPALLIGNAVSGALYGVVTGFALAALASRGRRVNELVAERARAPALAARWPPGPRP